MPRQAPEVLDQIAILGARVKVGTIREEPLFHVSVIFFHVIVISRVSETHDAPRRLP